MNQPTAAHQTYEEKLYASRLVPTGHALFGLPGIGGRRHRWNRPSDRIPVLAELADRLSLNTILFARPAEPYHSIVKYLATRGPGPIRPDDSETRTFLVDLPVAPYFTTDAMAAELLHRKCVVIPGHGIAVTGKTNVAEAYTNYAAACFACFVKFFSDFIKDARTRRITNQQQHVFNQAIQYLPPYPFFDEGLAAGPFKAPDQAIAAIAEAGKKMVSLGLVDACFGNISYRIENILYITRTGTFLDDLEGGIAECPFNGPECKGQRPSSEFPAHREILRSQDIRGVLHGHPPFSVIMSMDCTVDCDHTGACHQTCPHDRYTMGIPIVPGDVGSGPYGLYTTVPRVIKKNKSAIVYGHGVFTVTKTDFNEALARMVDIERSCRERYFSRLKELQNTL
jgi:ribulose-5-phosphate 4-epimerase/fuculose-1-phosphate aldolase